MRLPPCALVLALFFAGCPAEDDGTDTQAMDTGGSEQSSAETSAGTTDAALGCAVPEEIDSTDGTMTPLQDSWGAACSVDADCVALLGDGAVCLHEAVVYELPQGYCSKPCMLPDTDTRVVMDDPTCDPMGGIACVGSMIAFQYCAPLCTDDAQCNRDGYICRQMPIISFPEDPSLCLMPDCCGEPAANPTCAND
jgi:hypothetical protein